MNFKRYFKILTLIIALAISSNGLVFASGYKNDHIDDYIQKFSSESGSEYSPPILYYNDYKKIYQDRLIASSETYIINQQDYEEPISLNEDSEKQDYILEVESGGLYQFEIVYYPMAGSGSLDINLAFLLDNELLFEEASRVYLPRIYKDDGSISQDSMGNDIRPKQVESPRWNKVLFQDNTGYNPEAFEVYIGGGSHTISLYMTQGNVQIKSLKAIPVQDILSYEEVYEGWLKKGYKELSEGIRIFEAENTKEKSNASIYPVNVRADAATSPSNPSFLKLNALSFSKPGDLVTWDFTVPVSGLYKLAFRVLQDTHRGMSSTRKILINGELPFAEARFVEFPFNTNWYTLTLSGSDGNPWLFYLEAGKINTISMESNTGRLSQTLSIVREAVLRLNMIARKITMVTGITPDLYRDYDFSKELPNLNEELADIYSLLDNEMRRLQNEMDYEGNELLTVKDILRQLKDFMDDQRRIPSRLGNFRTNISTLGTWLVSITSQSLTIDQICFYTNDSDLPEGKAGFIKQIMYDIRAVIGSFTIDYNSIGEKIAEENKLSVWAALGRDQANIVRQMINNSFTPENELPVSLSLVGDSSTLLQATLAGKGPDIALFVEKTLPVNLAARGALSRLDKNNKFLEIKDRFHPSAWVPYTFAQAVYAVPASQGFNVMFIRTDIFSELNIEIPDTWDDFYRILPVIQRNNMQLGVGGEAPVMFETLILQHKGRFFSEDMKSTAFDTKEVLDAFKMWTGFYSEYSLSLTYDVFSYFRSGVMPLVIADYTQYNQFAVAAPEINGLWAMFPIPGIRQEDGSISRQESSTGTATILMKNARGQEQGFNFLEWWSRTETQKDFALELEMTMGPAARYNTANMEAVNFLPWTRKELEIINRQWEEVWDIETIPSSYYVARNIANAFRNVVYHKANERETLNRYGDIIDKEIQRKNKELGFD